MSSDNNVRQYLLLGLVAVIAVAAGGFVAANASVFDETPDRVAVVELEGLTGQQLAESVEADLREARTNDSIKGVVLSVNSPGGFPAEAERMHTAVERTAEELPVMAAVDTSGASGAYLAMSPADKIYVAPSAQSVGSVGITGSLSPPVSPDEGATGPNKGDPGLINGLEDKQRLAELFADGVLDHRSNTIELSRSELLEANSYLGVEAVENGIADELGFTEAAIEDVAAEAGLGSYEIVQFESSGSGLGLFARSDQLQRSGPPYLAVDPSMVAVDNGTVTMAGGDGR